MKKYLFCLCAACWVYVQVAQAQENTIAGNTVPKKAVNTVSGEQIDAAVAEARLKNRQYWKTIKLVGLCGLVAALLLLQLRGRKRR